jgi:crotonobetainyl-CoA:carnitine CoA-transferase CaiB-like acyl-CoA transferase
MVAGPMAGQMLADLGAEVTKIEAIGGDPMRHLRPRHKDMAAGFMAMNRHKRSIQVNLKDAEGQKIARDLALRADVLLENARPGVLDRLGLSYASLRDENRGLVYASVSGFGPDGPYADRPAFDQVIQAMSGAMYLQGGWVAAEPFRTMMVDKYSASAMASAVLAALLHRERSGGEGQRITVSLLDAFSSFSLIDNLYNHMWLDSDDRIPAINSTIPIKTADGMVMGHIQTDEQFVRICRFLGREELIEDERFRGPWNRLSNIEAMWRELEKTTQAIPTAQIMAGVGREGVPIGPVNSIEDFLADPQVQHNESVVEYRDETYGRVLFANYPARFEKTPAQVAARSPKLGEHTDAVLAELGYSPEQIDAARTAGVVA